MPRPARSAFAALALLAALTALAPAQEVYMSGLANPRGLFVDADGTVLVAEAGSGGGATGVPITVDTGPVTFGKTGGISSRLGLGAQTRLLSGLSSIAVPSGAEATGPNDLVRGADGRLAVLFGLASGSTNRAILGADGAQLGTLSLYNQTTNTWSLYSDYAQREQSTNPDGDVINSNPFGLTRDGNRFVVADGGANVLWRDGGATLIPGQLVPSPFGPGLFPQASVPTSVTFLPGGGYLVSELGGFPFTQGASRLHAVASDGTYMGSKSPGFTSIVDTALTPDGSLLVLEINRNGLIKGGPGQLKRIRLDGTVDLLIGDLTDPTSIALSGDSLYVTNDALSPTGGQVLRYGYTPVPEPASLAALGLGALALLRRRRSAAKAA